MSRAIRLRQWSIGDFGKLLERSSGLVYDLVGLVAEFCVPLEHEWAPLPLALGLHYCNCMTVPSKTAVSCGCRIWTYQHFCSIYTIEECGTLEFDVRVQQTSSDGWHHPAPRWWTGILWCSEPDGFQDPLPSRSNNVHIDSLKALGQFYSSILDHTGTVETFKKNSRGDLVYGTRSLALEGFRGSDTTIGIRLVTLDTLYAVEFVINGNPTTTLYVESAIVSGLALDRLFNLKSKNLFVPLPQSQSIHPSSNLEHFTIYYGNTL